MPYVGRDPRRGNYLKLDDIQSSFNGSTKTFNLTSGGTAYYPDSTLSVLVSVGGTVLEPATDYGITNNQITFTNAPESSYNFFAIVQSTAVNIGVPGDGVVTAAKLAKPLWYDEYFKLDSANNRVGIGTENPASLLHLENNAPVLTVKATNASSGLRINVKGQSSGELFRIQDDSTTKFILQENGLTGIGKDSNLLYQLELQRNSTNLLRINNSGESSHGSHDAYIIAGGTYYQNPVIGGSTIKFNTFNGSTFDTRVRIDSSGRLLVGTDAGWGSSVKLHLASTGNTYAVITAGTSGNSVLAFSDDGTERGSIDYDHDGDKMLFKTAAGERLRITSEGYLKLAGTISGSNNKLGRFLMPSHDSSEQDVMYMQFQQEDTFNQLEFGGGSASYNAATKISFRTAAIDTLTGVERLQIDSSGNVYIGGVGASATAGSLWLNDTSANASKIWQDNGNSALVFGTGSGQGEKLRITSTGQIRIDGATSANHGLRFTPNGWNSYDNRLGYCGTSGADFWWSSNWNPTDGARDHNGYATNYIKQNIDTGYLAFGTGGVDVSAVERLRIDSSGRLITGGNVTPYPTRTATFQPVSGQTNTYVSIIGGSTSSVSGITFGDAAGSDVGNYAGMLEYYHADDRLTYAQNASAKVTIDSAGKVGIGVTNPNNPLTIHGSGNHIYLKDTATNNVLQIRHAAGVAEFNSFDIDGSARRDFVFNQYTTEVLRITSAGLVGIGTDNPGSQSSGANNLVVAEFGGEGGITIKNDTNSMGHIFFADTDATAQGRIDYGHSGDYMRFYTANDERLRIDSDGKVGIGTNNVLSRLHVADTNTTVWPFASAVSDTYSYTPYSHELIIDNEVRGTEGSFAGIYFNAGADTDGSKVSTARIAAIDTGSYKADLVFSNRGSGGSDHKENLRITSSGALLVGTTSPYYASGDMQHEIRKDNSRTYTAPLMTGHSHLFLHNSDTTDNAFTGIGFRAGSGDGSIGYVYRGSANNSDFVINTDGNGNGVERLRVFNGGSVLIGSLANEAAGGATSGGSARLVIDCEGLNVFDDVGAASNYGLVFANDPTTDKANGIGFFNDGGTAAGGYIVHQDKGGNNIGDLIFGTASTADTPTEKLRITANGDIVTQGLTDHSFNNDGSNTKVLEITGGGTVGEYGQINISGNQNAGAGTVGVIKFINRENSASSSGSNAGSRQLGSIEMRADTDDSNAGDDCGGYFRFVTKADGGGNAERLRITSTGQLQATSAADVRLTLGSSGTAGTNNSVHVRADSADLKFMAASGGTTIFETNGTETLRITSGGNVNINGTPPWTVSGGDYRNLSISGETASSSGFLWLGNGTAATNADFDLGRINFCNGGTIVARVIGSTQTSANDDGRLTFYTKAAGGSEAERLRITSTGEIRTSNIAGTNRTYPIIGGAAIGSSDAEAGQFNYHDMMAPPGDIGGWVFLGADYHGAHPWPVKAYKIAKHEPGNNGTRVYQVWHDGDANHHYGSLHEIRLNSWGGSDSNNYFTSVSISCTHGMADDIFLLCYKSTDGIWIRPSTIWGGLYIRRAGWDGSGRDRGSDYCAVKNGAALASGDANGMGGTIPANPDKSLYPYLHGSSPAHYGGYDIEDNGNFYGG